MSYLMFGVGFTIFCLYIVGLLYMINKSHLDQRKDLLNDPEISKNFKDKIK